MLVANLLEHGHCMENWHFSCFVSYVITVVNPHELSIGNSSNISWHCSNFVINLSYGDGFFKLYFNFISKLWLESLVGLLHLGGSFIDYAILFQVTTMLHKTTPRSVGALTIDEVYTFIFAIYLPSFCNLLCCLGSIHLFNVFVVLVMFFPRHVNRANKWKCVQKSQICFY